MILDERLKIKEKILHQPLPRRGILDTKYQQLTMFLQIEDLKNNIYNYQVEQITEGDESITLQALDTAEQEVKSYFYTNHRKEFLDGRNRYDVDAIFSAVGEQRNALIVSLCLSVAKWYIVDLCNADIIYEQAKERYDRAIEYLKKINKGDVSLGNLPLKELNKNTNLAQNPFQPFVFGSREKFNHE